ncbi:MAG: NAD-dependent epimerase/dehydratase family protein [Bacillota bacterium]|nr:NAD-dependent epimerase/dehydratase family protein [Bacillota bacterium]
MKYLVIGGAGFIGHNLVLKLLNRGHSVRVFDRKIHSESYLPACDYVVGNFSKIENHQTIFHNIDIVYHLISTTLPKSSNENPVFDVQTNVVSSINLLKMCCHANVKKIIFTSSGGTVYGIPKTIPITEEHPLNPICSYGITKLAIEKYLSLFHHLYGLDYQVLRLSNPFGPFQDPFLQQGVIAVFLGKILRNQPIEIWGDGTICRDYIYIDDAAEALYLSSLKSTKSKIINIGTGKGTTLTEVLAMMAKVLNKNMKINYKNVRNVDVPVNVLDIQRAFTELNWAPAITMEQGIRMTCDWLTKNLSGLT